MCVVGVKAGCLREEKGGSGTGELVGEKNGNGTNCDYVYVLMCSEWCGGVYVRSIDCV